MSDRQMAEVTSIDLDELRVGPTAALFEGGPRAGAGITMFVVRTPPGSFVELHTHPYPETFVLLAGAGRWTAGGKVIEAQAERMISVPANTLHGFRNIGDVPLLVVSVHESPTLIQEFLDEEPA
ncbi:MAG TPA: cupin domain-containing protein [Solirubrobacteraceae bacterium]|jgi:quercetin dioxygenase-like cupin family protein